MTKVLQSTMLCKTFLHLFLGVIAKMLHKTFVLSFFFSNFVAVLCAYTHVNLTKT